MKEAEGAVGEIMGSIAPMAFALSSGFRQLAEDNRLAAQVRRAEADTDQVGAAGIRAVGAFRAALAAKDDEIAGLKAQLASANRRLLMGRTRAAA